MRPCPSAAELLDFHRGALPDEAVEELAAHLESCRDCEAAMRELDLASDPVLAALRLSAAEGPAWARWRTRPAGPRSDAAPIAASPDPAEPESWPRLPGYEVVGYLGRGGMGVVYKARDRRLGRLVALKRLRSDDEREVRRSRLEAETLARLQHPHIVQLYEMPEHDGRFYLAMELVEGEPLSGRLARPHQPRRAAELVETLARAVHYAHGHGIIHRDLKPSNIMLAGAGRGVGEAEGPSPDLGRFTPKIMDFGVAKRLTATAAETRTGDVIGTPSYMAPEQAAGPGVEVGPATDVYSLGVVLYELLTGRVPLLGPTTLETLYLVCNENPVAPRRFQPKVPRDLETICLKCLEKDPTHRYATADELAEDLGRFVAGSPVRARPTPAWERAWKWTRRRPAIAGLSAAVVLVAAVGLAMVAWQWRRAAVESAARAAAAHLAEVETRKAEALEAGASRARGTMLCETGEVGPGLLWLARAHELASRSDDADLERVIRSNLAAWGPFLVRLRARLSHDDWVWAVALSPDGRAALTGGGDGVARLWGVETGMPLGRPMVHGRHVWSVAFSPDGKRILTGSGGYSGRPGEARLWSAQTGEPLGPPIAHTSRVTAARFGPDGATFLTVCDEGAQVWDAATGHALGDRMTHPGLTPEEDVFRKFDAVLSPDGRLVASGGEDGTARLWEAATGRPLGEPLRALAPITAIALSPSGDLLATGGRDGGLELWDVSLRARRGPVLHHRGRIKALAFSPDGGLLASAGEVALGEPTAQPGRALGGEVRVWDATGGRALGRPLWHPQPVWALAFSPDSSVLMTGSRDATVRFFLSLTGQQLGRELESEGNVTGVAIDRGGALAISASSGGNHHAEGRLWDLSRSDAFPRSSFHPGGVSSLALAPDGRDLLIGSPNRTARLWDPGRGRPAGPPIEHDSPVSAVAYSPDGRSFLTATEAGDIRLWDRESLRLRMPALRGRPASCAAFSPDGATFLVGDVGGGLQLRRADDGGIIRDFTTTLGPVRGLVYSAGDRVVGAVSEFGVSVLDRFSIRVWGAWSGPPGGNALAFAPDETRALVVTDGLVRFIDLSAQLRTSRPLVHGGGRVARLVLSPDGRSALISGADRVTRLWDLATGSPLGPPMALDEINAATFSRDGRKVALSNPDGRVTVWDVPADDPIPAAVVRDRIERLTGAALDPNGTIRPLSGRDLGERRRLEALGGESTAPP